MSIWKKIENFDAYSISDGGEVRNDNTGKILSPYISTSGYYCLTLWKNERNHIKYIHRLLCEAFKEKASNKSQVDHIDGNKLNNSLRNLRWVSASENRLAFGYAQRAKSRQRKVLAINMSGEIIAFESRKSAANHFLCTPSKIKYGYKYSKGTKSGWIFKQVKDIV